MNNVLELKGKRFLQTSKNGMRGGIAMNGKVEVSTEHLLRLKSQLIDVYKRQVLYCPVKKMAMKVAPIREN